HTSGTDVPLPDEGRVRGVEPRDDPACAVEGRVRVHLRAGRGGDGESRAVKRGPVRGHTRRVDVGVIEADFVAPVLPKDEEACAVEGDGGRALPALRVGDQDLLGDVARWRDPLRIKVRVAVRELGVHDQVGAATEGKRRRLNIPRGLDEVGCEWDRPAYG